MDNHKLTPQVYWDNYWSNITLPLEIRKSKKALCLNEILSIFDQYLPKNDRLSVLEIGGAAGQFLVYMNRNSGYDVHCLDYSNVGCIKTKENFRLLNVRGNVHQKDDSPEKRWERTPQTHVLGV